MSFRLRLGEKWLPAKPQAEYQKRNFISMTRSIFMTRHPALRPTFAWLAGFLVLCLTSRCPAAELLPDLELVPRDAAAFFHVRVADVYKSEGMTLIRHFLEQAGPEAIKTFQDKHAPDPTSIERVTLVMMTPQALQDPFPSVDPEAVSALVIVRTSKPYDRQRVAESLASRKSSTGATCITSTRTCGAAWPCR